MIKNSNIVITGTSSGVGYELAKKFLNNGNKVWGCSRNNSKINKKNYFHTKIDLSNAQLIKKWVKKLEKSTNKKIDIFISNASIFNRKLITLDNEKSIAQTINVNLIAPMLIVKEISKSMIQNKKGTIIFFSSIASVINEAGSSVYASSKSALETFSKTIKKELANFNIKVITFRILYISTKLSDKLDYKVISKLKKKFKTNKFGSVEKIFENINKLHIQKNINVETIFFDKQKN